MTREQLFERIVAWEDTHTEFKQRERSDAETLAEDIVAMANSGGEIIFGVDKEKKIVGVDDPDVLRQLIDNVCQNNIEPRLATCDVQTLVVEGKRVIVASIPRGPSRPYRTNRGKYYMRGAGGKHMASREEVRELMIGAGDFHPDEIVVEDTDLADFDRDFFQESRPELAYLLAPGAEKNLLRVLEALQLVRQNHLTIAGLLCFGRNPQRFKPHWSLTAIRHQGTELGADFLDRHNFESNVDRQLHSAQQFLENHITRPDKAFGSLPPLPGQPPPVEAVMEAVVNAVAHRDYFLSAQVRLFVFDDRIEVYNPGTLMNCVSIEGMKLGGLHHPRNPTLFANLARRNWAKSAGVGVANMIRQMRERGLPEPELVAEGNQFRVTLRARP